MTAVRPTRRRGFTLIEILVVITLIALLAAIAVGAYSLVLGGQSRSNTESTVNKIASLLENKRAAVTRLASTEAIPNALITFSDDPALPNERARSMWLYMRLAQEFPISKAEANASITGGTTGTGLPLMPRSVFSKVQAADPYEESAACLYLALTDSAAGGNAAAMDGLENKTMTTANGNKVFKDEWNRPIVYLRWAYTPELDAPPYVPAPNNAGRPASLDPMDPKGKLATATGLWTIPPTPTDRQTAFWTSVVSNYAASTVVGPIPIYPGKTRNWVMAVVSAGPTAKNGSSPAIDLPQAFGSMFGNDDAASDNIVSFRLRAAAGNGSK